MSWTSLIDELAASRDWSYHAGGPVSTEPAALTALALLGHNRIAAAVASLTWMAELQADDGSVGVTATQTTPTWATSLAVVAWQQYQDLRHSDADTSDGFQTVIDKGVAYLLSQRGATFLVNESTGHDTMLTGWSWAADTHSWIEPTAFHVWALKAAGHQDHARTREAIRLLENRQISGGGCNYGNTNVLGQQLLAHHQPTAIALLALADEAEASGTADEESRRELSVAYLVREWPRIVGTSSTCYAAMALAAYGRVPVDVEQRLNELLDRRLPTTGTHPLALLALANGGRSALPVSMLSEVN